MAEISRLLSRHWLRRHTLLYCLIIGALLAINIYTGGGWWSFWPTLGWGVVLAIHYFVVGSLNIDEAWVDERIQELRDKSYDFDHIRDIERRVEEHDPSVTPADRRGDPS